MAGAACDITGIVAHPSRPAAPKGEMLYGRSMPGTKRRPRFVVAVVRALLVTFLISLLALAVSLLAGILGAVIYSRLERVPPNFGFVYKNIAAPFAIVVGGIVLVLSVVMEVRHYRQAKALAAIERAG